MKTHGYIKLKVDGLFNYKIILPHSDSCNTSRWWINNKIARLFWMNIKIRKWNMRKLLFATTTKKSIIHNLNDLRHLDNLTYYYICCLMYRFLYIIYRLTYSATVSSSSLNNVSTINIETSCKIYNIVSEWSMVWRRVQCRLSCHHVKEAGVQIPMRKV